MYRILICLPLLLAGCKPAIKQPTFTYEMIPVSLSTADVADIVAHAPEGKAAQPTCQACAADRAELHEQVDRVEAQLAARNQARAARDFATSDALRDELAAKGVGVMDGDPLGWDWKLEVQ